MVENYVSKSISCACGKKHISKVEKVEIANNVIENSLVDFLKTKGYKKLTVVCDKNTYRVAGERVVKILTESDISFKLHIFREDEVLPNEYFIGNLAMGMLIESDLILAVGSGTINDICRYVSAVAGKPFCTVGTAPSMDGYISGGSALIHNNMKLNFETHAPVAVFLDPLILSKAPADMIASGVGDLLGKISCLSDWYISKIVTNEWYCEFISGLVDEAIKKVLGCIDGISSGDSNSVAALVDALLVSGVCMDFAENSRPASGCEHHMSHFVEMRYLMEGRKAVFHGTKVGINTIIALKAYEYLSALEPDFNKIKTAKRKSFEEWEKDIKKAFLNASDEISELEKKSGKNSAENLSKRLASVETNWETIRSFARGITGSSVVCDSLKKLNAPVTPKEIGVEKDMAKQMILYAKELRDRYTVLQLLWDLNELENFASIVIEEIYG